MKEKTVQTAKKTLCIILLVGSVIGWPLSALTFASKEPQFILGLSWIAIILAALDGLLIVQEGE